MPGRLYEATWERFSAWAYDRFLHGTEEAGLRQMRHDLIAGASGRTIEIGAGTGLNLRHYPSAVTELTLTEPSPAMAGQLMKKLAHDGHHAAVMEAPAEELPFETDSVDTVVGTLMMCTVPDPEAALREVARVLKPGGKYLFLEHVRAEDPESAKWQDRLERPWMWFAVGCHPNRDTLATIKAAGLVVDEVRRERMPKAPPIVRPVIAGVAHA